MHRLNWGEERSDKPRRGRWSHAELALLKDWYGLRDEETIARELNRSPASVRKMAATLFRETKRSGPWTVQEVQALKRYLGVAAEDVIARILGRSPSEVKSQIFELGRIKTKTSWSQKELQRLKRIYGTRSDGDLAVIFSRSVDSVREQATKLCLAKDKAFLRKTKGTGSTRMPRWQPEELELLRRLYPNTPNLEIARQLDRSVKSVVSKAHHMGLKKEIERLREMGRQNVSLRYRGAQDGADGTGA